MRLLVLECSFFTDYCCYVILNILFNKFYSIGKGKQTIVPKYEGKTIGQRKMMSKTDCLKINDLYGCLGTPPNYNHKYYTLCNYMGL